MQKLIVKQLLKCIIMFRTFSEVISVLKRRKLKVYFFRKKMEVILSLQFRKWGAKLPELYNKPM